jgi:6-phosphogluconate dehydrogenase
MGMIGLGRMGANMSVRLMKAGHEIVAFDVSADSVKALAAQGAIAATSIEDMIAKLPAPRSIWLINHCLNDNMASGVGCRCV